MQIASNSIQPIHLSKIEIGIETNGVIRDDLPIGSTGKLSVADIFSVLPLGLGKDNTMCYPLVSVYVYAWEIKDALEVMTTIAPLNGAQFNLQLSGLKFTYNPNRVLFDRVTEILKGNDETGYQSLDYSRKNKKLYKIAANLYNTTLLSYIEKLTKGILEITPKDKNGKPFQDLKYAIIDNDKNRSGVQEAKEWIGLIKFMQTFPDIDSNGIPNVPEKYRSISGRSLKKPSWNPANLLVRANIITWSVIGLTFVILLIVAGLGMFIVKKIRN